MSDYVVVDHHHDPDAGVYRLVVGRVVEEQRPVLDHEGNTVHKPQPMLDENGDPLRDFEGREVVLLGPPEMELVRETVPVEDFVFAADDKRWKGAKPEAIAEQQRAEVRKALQEREEAVSAAEAARAELLQLPGSGEAL